jgi:DNA topoisomerase VI subunit A
MDILRIRIMADDQAQIHRLIEKLAAMKGIQADQADICPNRRGTGFRGYMTVVITDEN